MQRRANATANGTTDSILPVTNQDTTALNNKKRKKKVRRVLRSKRKGKNHTSGISTVLTSVCCVASIFLVFYLGGKYLFSTSSSSGTFPTPSSSSSRFHPDRKQPLISETGKKVNKKNFAEMKNKIQEKQKKQKGKMKRHMMERQQQQEESTESKSVGSDDDNDLADASPLQKFPSLQYALEYSDMVGIYFAASWCPDSTPATQTLMKTFGSSSSLLLPPQTDDNKEDPPSERYPFSIVYVSSDKSEQDALTYGDLENWIRVPFESSERTELKRHFQTCANSEKKKLNVHRKYGIPTLIVVDSDTESVLTTDGMGDVESLGADSAIERWEHMQSLVAGLANKYEQEY